MNDKIRIKIRKLLALAGSPNEAEAHSAREMAEKLMKKHHLSLREMDKGDGIIEKTIRQFKTVRQWEDQLLRSVLDFTSAEAVYIPRGSEETLVLVGREDRVIQAKKLFSYLHETLSRLGEDYKIVVKDKDSFRLGMAQAVSENLHTLKKHNEPVYSSSTRGAIVPCGEEVLAREADAYLNENFGRPNEREPESFDPNSLGLGRAVGRKISLVEQLER